MKKIRKNIMMTETLDSMIKDLSEQSGLSQSIIISNAIHYYFKQEAVDYPKLEERLQNWFNDNFQVFNEELRRIRYAVNQLTKENKMILEFWNDYYLSYGNGELHTTNVKRASELKVAEEIIQERILKAQQQKYS